MTTILMTHAIALHVITTDLPSVSETSTMRRQESW